MLAGLLAAAVAVGAPAPALPLLDGAGRPAALARPGVMLFWRSDCAPCRLELADLPALRRAAAPLPLQPVELDGAPPRQPPATPTGLHATGSAAEVLSAWGGAPPRLPLAVALDAEGRLCARHTGLLGTDRLAAWALACESARARR